MFFKKVSLVRFTLVTLLITATATMAYAMMGIEVVTKERAQALGVDIRAKASGPKHVWVELEFKAEGDLKDFQHVSMEIRDGEELLIGYAPMKSERQKSGTIKCVFMASRGYLDKITLSIVTASIPHGLGDMVGHELQLKEFIDVKTLP